MALGLNVGGGPINPYLKRWMLFVDGENLTIRGQQYCKDHGLTIEETYWYKPDVYLWLNRKQHATKALSFYLRWIDLREAAERAFYYTSQTGDDDALRSTRESLWELGFTPEVFKKRRKKTKAKGVDIALTKDLLSNAFLDNYDVAVVITGDADFRPVISEIKRLGKMVCLLAFSEGGAKVDQELKLSADFFLSLEEIFSHVFAPQIIRLHSEREIREHSDNGDAQ